MLFRWAPSESLPVFSYWVCGRQYLEPEPKECYVAYHESTPQQMVELCFRLSFGMWFDTSCFDGFFYVTISNKNNGLIIFGLSP